MVDYADVPTVNALYDEQARVQQGIALIDAGGKVASFTITPPPPVPGTNPGPMMMSVSIGSANPTDEMMISVRESLVVRDTAISAELTALGVTSTPPPPDPAPPGLMRRAL